MAISSKLPVVTLIYSFVSVTWVADAAAQENRFRDRERPRDRLEVLDGSDRELAAAVRELAGRLERLERGFAELRGRAVDGSWRGDQYGEREEDADRREGRFGSFPEDFGERFGSRLQNWPSPEERERLEVLRREAAERAGRWREDVRDNIEEGRRLGAETLERALDQARARNRELQNEVQELRRQLERVRREAENVRRQGEEQAVRAREQLGRARQQLEELRSALATRLREGREQGFRERAEAEVETREGDEPWRDAENRERRERERGGEAEREGREDRGGEADD